MPVPISSAASLLVWLFLLWVARGAWWPNLSPNRRIPLRTSGRPCRFLSLPEEDNIANAAEQMRQQAAQLRDQVQALEKQKRDAAVAEQRQLDEARAIALAQRTRYSAVVPIRKPDGSAVDERCDFAPRWHDGSSFITTCEATLTLGVILGESE